MIKWPTGSFISSLLPYIYSMSLLYLLSFDLFSSRDSGFQGTKTHSMCLEKNKKYVCQGVNGWTFYKCTCPVECKDKKMKSNQISNDLGRYQELTFYLVCQRPFDFSFGHLSLSVVYFSLYTLGSPSFSQLVPAIKQTWQPFHEHEFSANLS